MIFTSPKDHNIVSRGLRSLLLCLLLACITRFVGGCAGGHPTQIEPLMTEKPAVLTKPFSVDVPVPYALVVLRYPATVNLVPANRAAMIAAYRLAFTGTNDTAKYPDEAVLKTISERLTKTTYYAFEMRDALLRKLPPGSVVLSPALLDTDMQIHDAVPPPPHVLRIDFCINVELPRVTGSEGSNDCWPVDTFANKMSPTVSVTYGSDTPRPDSNITVPNAFIWNDAECAPGNPAISDALAAAYGVDRDAWTKQVVPCLRAINGFSSSERAIFAFGDDFDNWLVGASAVHERARDTSTGARHRLSDSPFDPLWNAYANAVVEMLNCLNWEKCARQRTDGYLELTNLNQLNQKRRDKWLTHLVSAEIKACSEQDEKTRDMLYWTDFGNSVRVQDDSEQIYSEQMGQSRDRERTNAIVSGMVSALAISAQSVAVAKGTYTPQMGQSVALINQAAINNIVIVGQEEAGVRSALGVALDSQFHRVQMGQIRVVIETASGQQEILANDLGGLRDKIREAVAKTNPESVPEVSAPQATPPVLTQGQRYDLKLHYAAGQQWRFVERSTTSGDTRSGNGIVTHFSTNDSMSGSLVIKEAKNGIPVVIQASYAPTCFIQMNANGTQTELPFPLAGCQLAGQVDASGRVSFTDPNPDALRKIYLNAAEIAFSPDQRFCPPHPVAIGEQWAADPKTWFKNAPFCTVKSAQVKCRLSRIDSVDGRPAAEVIVSSTIKTVFEETTSISQSNEKIQVDLATGAVLREVATTGSQSTGWISAWSSPSSTHGTNSSTVEGTWQCLSGQ